MTTDRQNKGFYEAKGLSRYTMILAKKHKDKLAEIAEKYEMSQGNVIEVLLDTFSDNLSGATLREKAKTVPKGGRKSNGPTQLEVLKMLKGMTTEQLSAAQAAIQAVKEPA